MLITVEKHPHHTVHDCAGTQIMGVSSFDTETSEIIVTLLLGKRMPADFHAGYKPLLMPDPECEHAQPLPVAVEVSLVLPGAYAIDPKGQLVK
jgi:hypothetical protein